MIVGSINIKHAPGAATSRVAIDLSVYILLYMRTHRELNPKRARITQILRVCVCGWAHKQLCFSYIIML